MYKYPNVYFEILLCVIKMSYLYLLTNKFNYIAGLIIFYVSMKTYLKLLAMFLKSYRLTQSDKIFLGNKQSEVLNLVGIWDIENFNETKIKSKFKEVIENIPKLNSKLIYFMGNYYWKPLKLDDTRLNRIIKTAITAKDYDEAIKIAQKEINIPLDITESPFECILIKYTDQQKKVSSNNMELNSKELSNGCVIFKMDHSLSDGLGIVTLLMCMSDNFSLDLFPPKFKALMFSENNGDKTNNSIKIEIKHYFNRFKATLAFNLINLFNLISIGIYYIIKNAISNSKNVMLKKDVLSTGKSNLGKPIEFELDQLKKLAKHLKCTLNDLLITLISNSVDKYSEIYCKEERSLKESLSIFVPIGNTSIATSLKKVNKNLKNNAAGVNTYISVVKDINNGVNTIKSQIKSIITKKFIADTAVIIVSILFSFFPFNFIKAIGFKAAKKIDMCVSNIPGPVKKLEINGCKIKRMLPMSSTGPNKSFIILFSYNGKITLSTNFDVSQNINADDFNVIFKNIVDITEKTITQASNI